MKIVFPSLKTVQDSIIGEPVSYASLVIALEISDNDCQGGGTMFCRTSQWEASKFPRELFHDSNSTGGRVLMHTKVISSANASADATLST